LAFSGVPKKLLRRAELLDAQEDQRYGKSNGNGLPQQPA
jgi:hypothetical protein